MSKLIKHCVKFIRFVQIIWDYLIILKVLKSIICVLTILSFVAVFCAFWTGLTGCWKRSAGAITATAILMLCACLLAAGAMGLWHTVEFFEKEKVVGEDFYQQWSSVRTEDFSFNCENN